MIEVSLLQYLAPGRAVAVLAGIIFIMYVRDRKSSEKCLRDDRVFMEDRLTKILESDQLSREANTKALVELIVLLRTMNRGN